MYKPLAIALLGVAVLTSPLRAQMRGVHATAAAPPQAGSPSPGHIGITFNSGHSRFAHRFGGPRTVFFPTPYFYPDYDDYAREPEAPPPQIVVMQPTPAPAAAPTPEARTPEPLLLEWQGDHWVRVTSYGQSATADSSEESNRRSARPVRNSAAAQPPHELPPAVLVFRDGRKEEVSSYTIVSGTIYTKADYWTSGSWTKKIQIADLDLPTTFKLNQERGVNFALPGGPHEVVIRP